MKDLNSYIVLILVWLFSIPGIAQELSVPEGTSQEEYLQQTAQDNWLINEPALLSTTVEANSVFITQTGGNNAIDYAISSSKAEIHLIQTGDLNNIQMQLSGNHITEKISQEGNGNFFYEVSLDTPENTFGLLQKGNYNRFEKYGANSISNNMNLEVTGDSKTIIIRNFP